MKKMNRREAAVYCGVSTITIDRALAKNVIGHFRIGRRVVFAIEHLDRFLKNCEQGPIQPESQKNGAD
jgi:excisionase family DNA binding protein